MSKQEVPLHALSEYLPAGALEPVLDYLHRYRIHLTITRERQSVLGDYRHAHAHKNHRISVNGNLNPYAFLITLLHEMAHLLTFEQHGARVSPHGTEWKQAYSRLLAVFLELRLFPADVQEALLRSIRNPAASSCGEEELMRVLLRYDQRKPGVVLIEELPIGASFKTPDGRVFRKGEKLRKRHRAVEVTTGHVYLFYSLYEVEQLG